MPRVFTKLDWLWWDMYPQFIDSCAQLVWPNPEDPNPFLNSDWAYDLANTYLCGGEL